MSQTLSATEQLCGVNAWIEASVQRFASSDQYIFDFAILRSRLKVAADCVRIAAPENSLESRKQISLYRENLTRLQRLLPAAQTRMQAQRQRLGIALNLMHNLDSWTESSQASLSAATFSLSDCR